VAVACVRADRVGESQEQADACRRAKKAARTGPVFITDRGKPAQVLLSIDEYRRLVDEGRSIVDLLGMPGADDVEFEPGRLLEELPRPADLR